MDKFLRIPEDIYIDDILLSDILKEHHLWIETSHHEGKKAKLSGANLQNIYLCETDFRNADLSAANLSGADLSRAILNGADLSNTNLSKANLSGAFHKATNLSKANLSEANLEAAKFSHADLSNTDLSRARLAKADFWKADLSGADLSGANLSEANLSGANLSETNLSRANLFKANLSRANLSESILKQANIYNADLNAANLSRANLQNIYSGETDFRNAQLSYADLSGAHLTSANLYEADLSYADFSKAILIEINLSRAFLKATILLEASLIDANMRNCLLDSLILTGAVFKDVATQNWNIKNIECDYIFLDRDKKERYPKDRDFEEGEFERLYKSLPTIDIFLEEGTNLKSYIASGLFDIFIQNQENKFGLKVKSIDVVSGRLIITCNSDADLTEARKEAESTFSEINNNKLFLEQFETIKTLAVANLISHETINKLTAPKKETWWEKTNVKIGVIGAVLTILVSLTVIITWVRGEEKETEKQKTKAEQTLPMENTVESTLDTIIKIN